MKSENLFLDTWKQQLDVGFRTFETLLEGATKLHEVQLDAACGAHADAVATQKKIAQAADASEVLTLQAQWAAANMENWMAYWRLMHEAMSETNTDLANCLKRKAA